MAVKLEGIEALGIEPIPGERPGGIDLRGDDDFDWIEEGYSWLIAFKSSSGARPVGGPADPTWDTLAERSIKVLREKSKDLKVAVYMSLGLFHESGFAGLSYGLKVIDGLLRHFWDTMYPPPERIKIRVNSLEHLNNYLADGDEGGKLGSFGRSRAEQLATALDGNLSQSEMQTELQRLEAELKGIEESLNALDAIALQAEQAFPPGQAPTISALRTALQNLLPVFKAESDRHKPGGGTAAESTADGAGTQTSAAPTPRPAAAPSGGDAPFKLDDFRKTLKRAGPALRELDPSDPSSYRLLRMGVWGALTAIPPHKDGEQMTRVPPGPVQPALIDALNKLAQSANWLNLLNQAEAKVADAPLWLDLQQYVHAALKGLGPAYESAAGAVVDETGILLRRLAGLENFSFAGGIPFASETTRQWIATVVRKVGQAEGASASVMTMGSAAPAANGAGSEEVLLAARQLMNQSKLGEALALLRAEAEQAASRRERFRWQTAMAGLLLEARKPRIATPILDGLVAEIDRFALEAWDPELCLAALVPLLRVLKAEKHQEARANEIFGRICRLDMDAGLQLE